MDNFLNYKRSEDDNYYRILGCDETASVIFLIIIIIMYFAFLRKSDLLRHIYCKCFLISFYLEELLQFSFFFLCACV